MSLVESSVRRPVFTIMVTLIVVILGLASLSRLQIDLLPSIELPTLTIRTQYEGASPVVIERLVTQIVEEIVATVPGVEEIASVSSEGNSSVRVSFAWGTDIDTAAVDIKATLEDEISELPDDIVGPRVTKFDIDSFPVVLLGISSDLDPVELTQFIEDQIRYRFARIPAVAQVDPWGGFNREVRIELDPDRINALGLPLDQVLTAIRDANLDLPAGKIEVAKRVLAEIAAVNQAFPQIRIIPVINQGNFIERSIANVARSVLYGGGLAVLVLLFFLRNLRSTLIISLAIPISVIATFALLYFGGFTLNLMTLGGLALGVGMMVDSSVVVVENIFRRRQENQEALFVAAVEGTREVGGAIIASTITTLVIFLPLIFVRGVSGVLFKELAYVIMFSLFCSLLVSLSLVPMLATKLLNEPQARPAGWVPWVGRLVLRTGGWFRGLENAYRDLLHWVLRHRLTTLSVAMAICGSSLLLLPLIGTEFLPPSDEGEVRVTGEMEAGTRLELVDQQTRRMEGIVYDAVPEAVSSVVSVVTSSRRAKGASQGEIRLSLLPAAKRARSNTEIAKDLRRRLDSKIPGMKIRTRAPQGQFLLERLLASEEGVVVEIRGFELATLDALSLRVAESITDVPGITDVNVSRKAGTPQLDIRVDREKIADLGLSVRDVTEVIETAVAGSQAGEFRTRGNSYRILVQLENAERRSLDEILNLTLTTASGEQVTLRNIVAAAPSRGPILIDRKDQQRLVSIKANVAGRDLGSVARDVQARLDQIPRPTGYDLLIAGNFEEQQKAFQELVMALALALILVYMVLASQYESLRDPLVVMVSVPLAAVGVLLILFLTKTTLNLQSFIGCIMLGGIVVNNAILLVDQAGQLRRTGTSVHDAVAEAGRRRLRPILMTTLTTILALLPLAFGIGEGADAQAPLARAVIGGLTGSTLITLVLIPVVYSLFHPEPEVRELA